LNIVYRADGVKYVGKFARNQPNGSGILFLIDGQRIEGTFKDGHPHGLCTQYGRNDERGSSAIFANGLLI
jgi:hypothetical protein